MPKSISQESSTEITNTTLDELRKIQLEIKPRAKGSIPDIKTIIDFTDNLIKADLEKQKIIFENDNQFFEL